MRSLWSLLFPAAALALCGCAATPPSTAAGSAASSDSNKKLVRELTEVVWNRRGLDRIPEFYAPDFVADHRPYVPLREGHAGIRGMAKAPGRPSPTTTRSSASSSRRAIGWSYI
jgi:hypothetical protein